MKLRWALSLLMVLSALFLIAGAVVLRGYSLVPFYLTAVTASAVAVLLFVAYYVNRGVTIAANAGTAVAIISILVSALSLTHNTAILDFFSSSLMAVLDILHVLAFYVFPGLFLLIRAVYWKELKGKRFN